MTAPRHFRTRKEFWLWKREGRPRHSKSLTAPRLVCNASGNAKYIATDLVIIIAGNSRYSGRVRFASLLNCSSPSVITVGDFIRGIFISVFGTCRDHLCLSPLHECNLLFPPLGLMPDGAYNVVLLSPHVIILFWVRLPPNRRLAGS